MVPPVLAAVSNYTVWQTLGPLAWPFWLLGIAIVLALRGPGLRAAWASRATLIAAFLLLLAFGVLPAGWWLLRPLEARFPQPSLDRLPPVTDIVVLTGAERLASSAMTRRLEMGTHGERIVEGAALAVRFPTARLWTVGGISLADPPVSDIGLTTDTWRRLGIPDSRIRAIGGTRDTCGNARGYRSAGGSGRPLLVTSAFHMPRAVACFRAEGIDPLPYPVDFQTWRTRGLTDTFSTDMVENLDRTDLALHEWAGLAVYRIRGRIDELWPEPGLDLAGAASGARVEP
jgi:uncharacterized SAM-binding protein YcdF (DUF218 family)